MRRLVLMLLLLSACEGTGPETREAGTDVPGADLSLHCPARDAVTCATDVGGVLPNALSGDTLLGDDDYQGSRCGTGGGVAIEDAAFLFTAPRAGTYRFHTEGSSFDTILSVRGGTCAAREVTCNDDAGEGVRHSSVTMTLEECETVTVVVDGVDDGGAFELHIGASESSCGDGVDDDGDGLTDCDDPDCFGPRCDVEQGDWPAAWATFEEGVYTAVNEQRAAGAVCDGETMPPVGPLERDALLAESARRHSLDMAERGYFEHDTPEGLTVADRTNAVGYESAFVGENIALGSTSVAQVMNGWMNSPGHCRNIMDPRWDDLGVGYADPGPLWTQNFGSR